MAKTLIVSDRNNSFFTTNNIKVGTEIPTSGTYSKGDIIVNIGNNTANEAMWICTEAGTPGTWEVVGSGVGGGGGSSLVVISDTVTVNSAVTEVSLGNLVGKISSEDKLIVHYNSTHLMEGVDYKVNSEGTKIVKLTEGPWNESGKQALFAFELFKNVKNVDGNEIVVDTKLTSIVNNIMVAAPTTEVEIGVEGFDKNSDTLLVFKNGVIMVEGVDYNVSEDSIKITSINEVWNESNVEGYGITFVVFKEVVIYDGATGGITMDMLGSDVRGTINNLTETTLQHSNLLEAMDGKYATKEDLGNIEVDLSPYQQKTDNNLQTSSKDLVGAINELFQNANNGKELIASAIGEPLNSNDTFSAMSTGINGLLSTFKTNMMTSGVVVESNDKFKQLIDKIKGLTEGEGNKGIQMTNGKFSFQHPIENTHGALKTTTVETGLKFNPTLIIVNCNITTDSFPYSILTNGYINNLQTFIYKSGYTDVPNLKIYIDNITKESFNLNVSTTVYTGVRCTEWYAIGVGEEDTTLRDSLASILQEEGVNVTEEDEMASLITKVDNEFNNKNTKAENTRSKLAKLMKDGGYDITGDEDIDTLLGLLRISGATLDSYKYTCTDEYILDKMYPMPQTHDAIPSGVTDTWKHQSRWENQERPTAAAHNCGQPGCPGAVKFQALGAWSNVYRVDGTAFTQNTGVEMKDIKAYGWYNGQWELVQHLPVPDGNFYAESFSGDSNTYFADSIKQSSTSKTIILREANKINGENCMYHPFSKIKNFDIKYEYVYICIDLRKVKFDENGVDDRDATHYCANCGGDWWLAEGLLFDSSWQHNKGIAQPKIVEITNEWQRFSMTTVPENWENGFPD